MPKNVEQADCCFQKALGLLLKYRNMGLPDAMKLADFSAREQACCAKRMCLHCLWKMATNGSKNDDYLTPPPQVVHLSTTEGTESSVTNDSGGVEEVEVASNLTTVTTKIPRIHLAIKAAQVRRAGALQKKKELHQAFKRATLLYARQREKPDRMSAQSVVDLIKNETGVELSRRTIQQKVKDGKVGMLPLRRGPKGNIPECHYRNLCIAYESYVAINQLNRKLRACRPKQVGPLVHKVIYGADDGDWSVLFKRMQNDTAINLRRQKARNAEDRRIHWTTHKNISMWFDNWEEDIIVLGFGT
jgi:hypothetical protein